MRPVQLTAIGMARAAVVGVVGAIGALAIATALSPLTPVGEARVAEPQGGVVVDPVVFGLGGLAIVAIVLLLGAVPAWRAGQVRRFQLHGERTVGGGASRIATAVSRAGAGPSVLVGVRHALERGRGRTSVPVATALVGTAAAVCALVATSVFGASLSTLLSTPRLYGQDFQVVLGSLTGPQVLRDRRAPRSTTLGPSASATPSLGQLRDHQWRLGPGDGGRGGEGPARLLAHRRSGPARSGRGRARDPDDAGRGCVRRLDRSRSP